MFGRKWSAFFSRHQAKPRKRFLGKGKGVNRPKKEVFLFATDGSDFASEYSSSPFKSQPARAHRPMTIQAMLEWLIYFDDEENLKEPFLKMFTRISLGKLHLTFHQIGRY